MASLLSIISLNTNKRADLGGLHSIIRDCQPHLVFLQEVKSTQILTSLASAYNYQVFASTLIQPQRPRICAILSQLPATTVLEILPGKAQMASIGALSFINIHAPTDDREAREALFSSLRTHLSLPVPPLLLGDFNCVLHTIDQSSTASLRTSHKYSTSLASLVDAGGYTDSFRTLHPAASVFSFYRRGSDPTRLDRIYLPPLLESRPRVARYLPCTSDHHAFFLRLETAGLAVLPSLASKKSASHYWKLNSSVLKEQSFLPAFRRMWIPLAASRPPPGEAASQTAATLVTPTPLLHW